MDKYLLIIFLMLITLMPQITIVPQVPALRIEDLVLLIFVLKELFAYTSNRKEFYTADRYNKPLLVIGAVAIFSILLQEVVFQRLITFNDIMILPMIAKYVIIYKLSLNVLSRTNANKIVTPFLLFGLCSALVGIMQYHNFLNINQWLTPLYQEETEIQSLVWQTVWARSIGTIGSPQKFGYLMVLCSGFCLSNVLYQIKTKISLVLLIIFIIAVIYTLSRTSVFILIVNVILLVSLYTYNLKDASKLIKVIPFLLLLLVIITNYFLTAGFRMRVLNTESKSYQHSRYARIRDLKRPFIEIQKNPFYLFFGKGPSKKYIKTSLHNDYSWMLERYGIIALVAYLTLIINSLKYSYRNYKITIVDSNKVLYLALFIAFFTFFSYAMAEDVFKSVKIMSINIFLMGILASSKK